jgi:(4-O-methyl)-D-glucuronate---lignin esterase
MSVDAEGRIVLPDGMSYKVLVLPELDRMTLPVLCKIRELVHNGATVLGPRPLQSPSLADYPNADREVRALAEDVWGDLDGISRTKRSYGKGTVVWGLSPAAVLASLHIPKDVEYSRALDANVSWVHRRAGNSDIYLVANRTDLKEDINARFRVSGKEAELWHADTGEIEPAEFSIAGGRTTVPLHLAERESVFVVFRRAAASSTRTLQRATVTTLATIDGPWTVSFPANLGAPAKITLAKLEPWTANADEGVKYFSGTATYMKTVPVARRWFRPGERILLNLGAVNDLAEVSVNGKPLGILWHSPYQVDVTSALTPGVNQLEIKVTNEWTNRLIGDRSVPPAKRVLAVSPSATRSFGAAQTLEHSGLLGPVTFVSVGSAQYIRSESE